MAMPRSCSFSWAMACAVFLTAHLVAGTAAWGFFSGRHYEDPVMPSDREGTCAWVVSPHGYQCHELQVSTSDGYVLSLQRIPGPRGGAGPSRGPVLLQHGVLMDGMTWLMNSPEESLAFILADKGYDVWIANTRGTKWSRRHVSLNPTDPDFWAWSWDELVTYDLPATVEFVYTQTGQKLNYVGHSMGTLIAFASLSEGKLIDKLRSAALLSPVAYLSHITTPIGIMAARAFVGEVVRMMGIAEFNPKDDAVINFLKSLCRNPGVDCYDMMSSFTGHNCCLNESTVELFLKYEPQSTSTKNMVHLAQTFRDGALSRYNYDSHKMNLEKYGQAHPPVYNMSLIPENFPLFLSYGGKDCLSDVRDVELLLDDLKFHEGDKLTVQFVKDFAHADFVMGVSAKDIVYNAIIAFFERHQY